MIQVGSKSESCLGGMYRVPSLSTSRADMTTSHHAIFQVKLYANHELLAYRTWNLVTFLPNR